MATTKPRFSITLDEELFKQVNDYQHNQHYATQTKAIVDLIRRGAESLGLSIPAISESEGIEFSSYEIDMIKKYRSLDTYGQKAVLSILNLEMERVTDQDFEPASEEELREFLSPHLFAARDGGLQPSNERRARHLKCIEKDLASEEGDSN